MTAGNVSVTWDNRSADSSARDSVGSTIPGLGGQFNFDDTEGASCPVSSIESPSPESDTEHPGRLALLTRAAYAPDVTEAERATLVRIGAPGRPERVVLEQLREAYRLHRERRGYEARAILVALVEPPQES